MIEETNRPEEDPTQGDEGAGDDPSQGDEGAGDDPTQGDEGAGADPTQGDEGSGADPNQGDEGPGEESNGKQAFVARGTSAGASSIRSPSAFATTRCPRSAISPAAASPPTHEIRLPQSVSR